MICIPNQPNYIHASIRILALLHSNTFPNVLSAEGCKYSWMQTLAGHRLRNEWADYTTVIALTSQTLNWKTFALHKNTAASFAHFTNLAPRQVRDRLTKHLLTIGRMPTRACPDMRTVDKKTNWGSKIRIRAYKRKFEHIIH